MKDKYLTIYDGQNWNLANKNIEMARLYEEKEEMLEEWLETNTRSWPREPLGLRPELEMGSAPE